MSDRMARALYEKDVVRWAHEQARLLREGDFVHLDIEHIADEIEDVGKANSGNSPAGRPCCSRIF